MTTAWPFSRRTPAPGNYGATGIRIIAVSDSDKVKGSLPRANSSTRFQMELESMDSTSRPPEESPQSPVRRLERAQIGLVRSVFHRPVNFSTTHDPMWEFLPIP